MKQSDVEKIHRIVVPVLARVWKERLAQDQIEDHVKFLSDYSDATLKAAMDDLVRNSKAAPRIAHIVDACRKLSGASPSDASRSEDFISGLRKRDETARVDARRYVNEFAATDLMRQAKAEGWDIELEAYVYEAAWLQAQYINAVRNPGFSMMPFANWGVKDQSQRRKEFIGACMRQAATRVIEVVPPAYLFEEWKESAAWRERQREKRGAAA